MMKRAKQVLMECGHSANAVDFNRKPFCNRCRGVEATIVATFPANLEGRKAECVHCKVGTGSSHDLPCFVFVPGQTTDAYDCGCNDQH